MQVKEKKLSVFEIDSVPRAVATLAIPSVLSMLVTVLYNMVDTVFVGQTHDPYQMNAVSMATPVFMILMAFGNLFGIGGCAFISRSLGAREYERVKKISSFSFWGAVVVGLLATFALTLGVSWILPLVEPMQLPTSPIFPRTFPAKPMIVWSATIRIWNSTPATICSTSASVPFPLC